LALWGIVKSDTQQFIINFFEEALPTLKARCGGGVFFQLALRCD
jgi:hypothetical protein